MNQHDARKDKGVSILILISMEMALQNIRSGSATRRDCLSGIEIKMGSLMMGRNCLVITLF